MTIFIIRNGNFPNSKFEVQQEAPEVLIQSTVWEVDLQLFPLKEQQEMLEYFQALYEDPEHVRVLPGFKETKYH